MIKNSIRKKQGFTVVELVVVVVAIGIIAAIGINSYNSSRQDGRNAKTLGDISKVNEAIKTWSSLNNGKFPSTDNQVLTNQGCNFGESTEKWIPEIDEDLPNPNNQSQKSGWNKTGGCYAYWSDGDHYIVSGWNMIEGEENINPSVKDFGFMPVNISQSPTCLKNNGSISNISEYYKFSYTFGSNPPLSDC